MGLASRGTAQAVRDYIGRYDLHLPGVLPVPIIHAARASGWTVVFSPGLWPALGIAAVNDTHRLMRVAEELAPAWQRYVVAHEIGHVLAAHSGRLFTCDEPQRAHSSAEREQEADRIAARLLIPDWLLREETSSTAVAERANVPVALVELRLSNLRACKQRRTA